MIEKLTAAEKKKAMGQLSGWKKSMAARPLKRLLSSPISMRPLAG